MVRKRRSFPFVLKRYPETKARSPIYHKILLGERETRSTCQSAPVFAGDHDDPIPLDGDGSGSAGQVGDVGDGDDQDVAGSLQSHRERLSVRVLHLRVQRPLTWSLVTKQLTCDFNFIPTHRSILYI